MTLRKIELYGDKKTNETDALLKKILSLPCDDQLVAEVALISFAVLPVSLSLSLSSFFSPSPSLPSARAGDPKSSS
jgi:hypothetical protein